MSDNIESDQLCEYVAIVKWDRAVDAEEAKWLPKAKLFTTQLVRASLEGQPETLCFIEKEFGVDLRSLREPRTK